MCFGEGAVTFLFLEGFSLNNSVLISDRGLLFTSLYLVKNFLDFEMFIERFDGVSDEFSEIKINDIGGPGIRSFPRGP